MVYYLSLFLYAGSSTILSGGIPKPSTNLKKKLNDRQLTTAAFRMTSRRIIQHGDQLNIRLEAVDATPPFQNLNGFDTGSSQVSDNRSRFQLPRCLITRRGLVVPKQERDTVYFDTRFTQNGMSIVRRRSSSSQYGVVSCFASLEIQEDVIIVVCGNNAAADELSAGFTVSAKRT